MDLQELNTSDLCLFASDLMAELPDGAVNSLHIYTATDEIHVSVNASRELMACLYEITPTVCIKLAENGALICSTMVPQSPRNITLNIKIYM